MASVCFQLGKVKILQSVFIPPVALRGIQTTAIICAKHVRAGRYKPTRKRTTPLTYEQAKPPYLIGVDKAWNSWNSSNLHEEGRQSETLIEDTFIRRFMEGTWHGLFVSDIIIKRRHNMIVIAGIIDSSKISKHKSNLYFLLGYTEELLACLLKCPVKVEVQSVTNPDHMIFKWI